MAGMTSGGEGEGGGQPAPSRAPRRRRGRGVDASLRARTRSLIGAAGDFGAESYPRPPPRRAGFAHLPFTGPARATAFASGRRRPARAAVSCRCPSREDATAGPGGLMVACESWNGGGAAHDRAHSPAPKPCEASRGRWAAVRLDAGNPLHPVRRGVGGPLNPLGGRKLGGLKTPAVRRVAAVRFSPRGTPRGAPRSRSGADRTVERPREPRRTPSHVRRRTAHREPGTAHREPGTEHQPLTPSRTPDSTAPAPRRSPAAPPAS